MGVPAVRTAAAILAVDLDAFYASVEVLRRPELRERPVVVGGTGARGVVASCSYVARAYGVRSAMPSGRARRLCPTAVFLAPDFDLYRRYSRRFHAVLQSFTPVVEGVALDEAYLDVSGARRLYGTGPAIAAAIRRRVADELRLEASIGVGANKLVAKLASEAAKPAPSFAGPVPGRGVVVVEPGDEVAFLHPLPVGALPGVGPATLQRLERFGVRTVGDLAALPVATVSGAVGRAAGAQLHNLAWGRDDRRVEPEREPRSVGHEETYDRDHHDLDTLRPEAARLADAVAARLRRQGLTGRTVTVKVRFGDFRTISRSRTLPTSLDHPHQLAAVALELLASVDPAPGVRLLGVSASNLTRAAARQLALDEEAGSGPSTARQRADQAVERVRRRFGEGVLRPPKQVN